MSKPASSGRTAISLEENLKKALTELMVLSLLSERERYIGELTPEIERRSGGIIHIEFPYAAIYRMLDAEYITEGEKRAAPDKRLRQYYKVTQRGKEYLKTLLSIYARFTQAAERVLALPENRE